MSVKMAQSGKIMSHPCPFTKLSWTPPTKYVSGRQWPSQDKSFGMASNGQVKPESKNDGTAINIVAWMVWTWLGGKEAGRVLDSCQGEGESGQQHNGRERLPAEGQMEEAELEKSILLPSMMVRTGTFFPRFNRSEKSLGMTMPTFAFRCLSGWIHDMWAANDKNFDVHPGDFRADEHVGSECGH